MEHCDYTECVAVGGPCNSRPLWLEEMEKQCA